MSWSIERVFVKGSLVAFKRSTDIIVPPVEVTVCSSGVEMFWHNVRALLGT